MKLAAVLAGGAMVAALVVALVASGCGRHAYGRNDLDLTLSKHHIDLRWGRLENAAQAVSPAMRAEFVRVWSERFAQSELQDLEIVGVLVAEGGDKAEVVVRVTAVDRTTMTVSSKTVTERWQRTDDGWLLEKPALTD
ncbi:MAG: hypothetical protein IT382_06980 [Deltaproteobacteria bacterium]|nr:hypothetical protein [Deltaproteobacteria bacterium]